MKNSIYNSSLFLIVRFKGYLIRKMLRSLIGIATATAVLCLVHEMKWLDLSTAVSLPSLLGAALGVLLVFRNNTAYERWWEARKILGELVNTSRNFALQVNQLLRNDYEKETLFELIAAFPYALKDHLRKMEVMEGIGFLSHEMLHHIQKFKHKPNAIANEMNMLIKLKYDMGHITDYQLIALSQHVQNLIDILGKCERIRNTPMPIAHTYLLKMYVVVQTLSMPFGLVANLGWWTILAVCAIYYVAMSIVIIAEEIEEPFGTDPNDLPVDVIVRNIHMNVKEIYTNSNEKSHLPKNV